MKASSTDLKVKKAYVILTLISLILDVAVVLFILHGRAENNHKFCDLLSVSTESPITKPADPVKDKAQERAWTVYEKAVVLSRGLGC